MDPVIKYRGLSSIELYYEDPGEHSDKSWCGFCLMPVKIKLKRSSKKLFIIISLSIMHGRKQQSAQIFRYAIRVLYSVDHKNNMMNISCIEKCARDFGVIYSFEALDQIIRKQTKLRMNEPFEIAAEDLRRLINDAKVSFVVDR